MKIRCTSASGHTLPMDQHWREGGYDEGTRYDLTVGRVYTVYAIGVANGRMTMLVCENDDIPIGNPSGLFELVDPRVSRYWILGCRTMDRPPWPSRAIFAFPEWAEDDTFYERLLNDDPAALSIFRRYRALMDVE